MNEMEIIKEEDISRLLDEGNVVMIEKEKGCVVVTKEINALKS